jgi:hypothetical protein
LREALFLIDPAEEPRLLLVAHGNLANCLLDAGRFAEAEALIADLRPLWEEVGAKTDLLRRCEATLGSVIPSEARELGAGLLSPAVVVCPRALLVCGGYVVKWSGKVLIWRG